MKYFFLSLVSCTVIAALFIPCSLRAANFQNEFIFESGSNSERNSGKSDYQIKNETIIPQNIDEMPEYPGGEEALLKYIRDSVNYPDWARINGYRGRVICTFRVNEKGKVVDVSVVKGLEPNLDKEAMRVISNMPDWKPGKYKGKPVAVKYTLPVSFGVQNKEEDENE